MKGQEFASAVQAFVEVAGDDEVRRVVALLQGGNLGSSSSVAGLRHSSGLTGPALDKLAQMIRACSQAKLQLSPEALAACVSAARGVRTAALENSPKVDLVWTGPLGFRVPARSTLAVLEDLIRAAREEVVLVGYSITLGAEPVFEALSVAARRGVRIVVVGNRLEEQLPTIRRLWPRDLPLPELFSRQADPADPYAALHAKLVVVDGRDMVVTSANLSEHGLRGNIEIGLRMKNHLASDVRELVKSLIQQGLVVRVGGVG